MAVSDLFSKIPVKVPNRSGFDLSHENLLTMSVGTLVPVMCDFLLPNDKVSLGHAFEVQLPPMATDFYGRVRLKYEAFFVPCRILYGGWQDFITQPVGQSYPETITPHALPYYDVSTRSLCTFGTLSDYLGMKILPSETVNPIHIPNVLRYFAYHKIYDDWYRDSRIQKPLFIKPTTSGDDLRASSLPYQSAIDDEPLITVPTFNDGVSFLSLRQRNWARDYFTNATPLPQAGSAASVSFETAAVGSDSSFTIASLRAANALQQWLERNNIAGARYADQIRAQFGVLPSDAVLDRAVYLGSSSHVIYNHSVYQTGQPTDAASSQNQNNPFSTIGTKYSSPVGTDKSSLIDSFTATEHGYLMVIASIVPDAIYGTGTNRDFCRSKAGDFAFPLLQGVGDQPIYDFELSNLGIADEDAYDTFGYTQRYSEYKFMLDEVHGLLRDGQSLSAFALKRSFKGAATLGSSFLQIPTTFLDDVAAASDAKMSSFGAWADMYFQYRKISTLSAYTIPTLGDPDNTHTEVIPNGGRRL